MTQKSPSRAFNSERKSHLEDRLRNELEFIRKRRQILLDQQAIAKTVKAIPELEPKEEPSSGQEEGLLFRDIGQNDLELVGLALSGGGLRSASVCLGALQGLNSVGVLDRIDYISTVSGGGYTGGAFVASSLQNQQFCFDTRQGVRPSSGPLKVGDTPTVAHLRDHSNFLAPHGLGDLLQDIALVVRGLITSAFVIAPYVVLAAALTVFVYSFNTNPIGPQGVNLAKELTVSWPFLAFPVATAFVIWSGIRRKAKNSEFEGATATFFGRVLLALAGILFLQFQDWVLQGMVWASRRPNAQSSAEGWQYLDLLNSALISSPIVAVVLAFFRNELLEFAKSQSTRLRDTLARQGSRILLFVGAMILPLLLWLAYLRLVYLGVERLAGQSGLKVVAGTVSGIDWQLWALLLIIVAIAAFAILITELIGPNSYSLHGLYRDRLRQAFLNLPKMPAAGSGEPNTVGDVSEQQIGKSGFKDSAAFGASNVRIHDLTSPLHPYPIFNTALNVQGSKEVNRRGRNADFFSFTPHYCGSPSTGYQRTTAYQKDDQTFDLATVMAISGAAAAANMGVNSNRPMAFTLAALNIRLGFWAPNPTSVAKSHLLAPSYLWREMTSALTEDQPEILLTDGGHVENLGAYELLRRRCKLVIIVDAEADPNLTFGSFYQLERFARIDLGVRITIDLEPIAQATRGQMAANRDRETSREREKGPHVALGVIHYDQSEHESGFLVYIKSSLTGDEPDYVQDYGRRNPSFPHETTADLFYSEEQFEAYRALGFHMVRRAFTNYDEIALPKFGGGSEVGFIKGRKPSSVPARVLQILGLPDDRPARLRKVKRNVQKGTPDKPKI